MKNRMRKTCAIALALALGAITASPVIAADEWESNLIVSVSGAENRLSFGQRADATDGVDGQYDVPPMLGGQVTAYFADGGAHLWRDVRALAATKSWKLHVESPLPDNYISLKWDPETFPAGAEATLKDVTTGVIINMKHHNLFTYKNIGPKELEIAVRN